MCLLRGFGKNFIGDQLLFQPDCLLSELVYKTTTNNSDFERKPGDEKVMWILSQSFNVW